MDTKNIEELRALAFASIPKVPRKPAPSHLKRKRAPVENEEGEIVSEDDAVSPEAYQSPLDGNNDSCSKSSSDVVISQKGDVIRGSHDSISQPEFVAIDSTICLASREKDENVPSTITRPLTVVKEDSKFSRRRRHSDTNISLSSRTGMPSKMRNPPTSVFGIRKEADAFLASLNIPTASPFRTEGFGSGERNNSLVIKFSDDDDSDSDRDQQGQSGSNNSENKKPIGNGTLQQGRLKSEIDRVKKQIAAFEKIKGKVTSSSAMRISKSALASEATRNVISKPGQYQTSVSSAKIPVDLESLRQQIAAKETELQLRKSKQQGSKDNVTLAVSNRTTESILPLMDVSHSRLGSPAENEHLNKPESFQGSVAGVSDVDGLSLKENECKSHYPETGLSKPAVATNNLGPPNNDRVVELHYFDTVKPVKKQNQLSVADKNDTKAIITPKRKRDDGERGSQAFGEGSAKKKHKQNEFPIHKVFSTNSGDDFSLEASIAATKVNVHKILIPPREGDDSGFVNFSDGNQEQPDASLSDVKCFKNSLSSQPTAAESQEEMLRDKEADMAIRNGFSGSGVCSIISSGDAENVEANRDLSNSARKQNIVSCVIPLTSNSKECINEQEEPRKGLENNATAKLVDNANKRISTSSEAQDDRTAFSDGQKGLQMVFIGSNNMCSSVPVWAFDRQVQNSNMHVYQGMADQRLEYGHDTLHQWQEEEDLIDKELEEAQQNRRRCEVRERLARKQFREAQDALRSANAQCDMLYQKRELLAARIKAAELQMYSNKSLMHTQYDLGPFLTRNSPKYSGKTSLRLETPLWSREDGTVMNVECNRNMDHEDQQISSKTCLSQGFELCSTDNIPASEDADHQLRKDAQNGNIESVTALTSRQTDENISKLDEKALVMRENDTHMNMECSSMSPMFEERFQTAIDEPNQDFNRLISDRDKYITEDSLIVSVVAKDYNEKDQHHGFSSASYATDLDRDTSSVHLNNASSTDQQTPVKQNELNSSSQSDSLTTPKTVVGDIVSEGAYLENLRNLKVRDEKATVTKSHLSIFSQSHSSVNCKIINADPVLEGANLKDLTDAKEIDVEVPTSLTNHFCHENGSSDVNRQDVYSSEQQFQKEPSEDCLPDFVPVHLSPVETAGADMNEKSDSKGTAFQSGGCQKGLSDHCLHSDQHLDLLFGHQAFKPLENIGTSSSVGQGWQNSHLDNVSGSFGSESSVPSSRLGVLFTLASSKSACRSAIAIWKEQSSMLGIDKLTEPASGKYESPLSVFRSYRDSAARLLTQKPTIDPLKMLCKYEHRGKCNNDECIWQHKRDYALSANSVSNHTDRNVEVSKSKDVNNTVEKTESHAVSSEQSDEKSEIGSISLSKRCRKWSTHLTKVPVYHIGSHIMKRGSFQSCVSHLSCKEHFGYEQCFPALHRELPFDITWLHDSSLKLQNLGDCSLKFRQLLPNNGPQTGIEGHQSNSLEDVESLLEAALELIDFDFEIQKSQAQRDVLYVLSRGLEVKPTSVALWVVYLHLFNRWEKSISQHDLYHLAVCNRQSHHVELEVVQHNSGSYELWMLFINSRQNLSERLEAYEKAIIALGSKIESQGYSPKERSSILLDLALQGLNCMCVSGSSQDAIKWIEKLILAVSKDDQSSASILLTHLKMSELCNLWICCAYLILDEQLPSRMIENLGCMQPISFDNIWQNVTARRPYTGRAMALMRIAASDGKGCLELDSIELPLEAELKLAKEVLAVNYVQCAAVCEGLEYSLTIVERYFNKYLGSVELTVLRARLESHFKGNLAGLNIFEEALSHWPLHQSGKIRLWNQYIGFAFDARGIEYVKVLLVRCATELYESESFRLVSKSSRGCTNFPRGVTNTPNRNHSLEEAPADDHMEVFSFLPAVVRKQLVKEVTITGQVFSYQDAAFGYMNLAFFRALDEKFDLARDALLSGLNIAMDTDTMKHCLQELAAFTSSSLRHSAVAACSNYEKMLSLFDRCLIEAQLLPSVHPLSKGFCESFRKRRVRLFVDRLLGPWPKDFAFLNTILETINGPTLLPNDESLTLKDLTDFTERMLEVLPNNVRLALSVCRTIEAKSNSCNSSTKFAILFWSVSILIDSLCHSVPEAPVSVWVEAGSVLEMLEVDSLSESFYQLAVLAYPFSSSLWSKLIAVGRKTRNNDSIMKLGLEKGVKLDLQNISEVTTEYKSKV